MCFVVWFHCVREGVSEWVSECVCACVRARVCVCVWPHMCVNVRVCVRERGGRKREKDEQRQTYNSTVTVYSSTCKQIYEARIIRNLPFTNCMATSGFWPVHSKGQKSHRTIKTLGSWAGTNILIWPILYFIHRSFRHAGRENSFFAQA